MILKLYDMLDTFLIAPFRYPENAFLGWWMGSILLSLWSTILGRMTSRWVENANKHALEKSNNEMVYYHTQSIYALKEGERSLYKAINELANEAFGKSYFIRFAKSAAALWPVALSMAWLHIRFDSVSFQLPFSLPMVGDKVGYAFFFIPTTIAMHLFIARLCDIKR